MTELFKTRWGLYASISLLNLLFLLIGIQWIFLIPYNRAPDENNHFLYSVRFIMENRRLPVAGVDDVECFRNAVSSYNKFPALNYLAAALGAGATARRGDDRAYLGARAVSLVWGLLFLNLLLAAAWRISQRCLPAVLAAGTVVLIPQVIFIASYVNADAFALAVSGLLAWSVVRLLQDTSRSNIWIFGASVGLLFSAKLNFFIYLPWLGVGGLALLLKGRVTWRQAGEITLAAVVMTLLISGGWYLRNWRLYGELLPLAPSPEWLAAIGIDSPPQRAIISPRFSWQALIELVRRGFFNDSLSFFYARFGYGDVALSQVAYALLKFFAPSAALLFTAAAWCTRDRAVRWTLLWLLGMALTNLGLFLMYAICYDYQPQGRYMFPMLAPAAVWMAWTMGRHPSLMKFAAPLLLLNGWLLFSSYWLLQTTYNP